MDVVIVGSIAYDSLSTPSGESDDELGGSATYGGFSSSFHSKRLSGGTVALVGVVGATRQGLTLEALKLLKAEHSAGRGPIMEICHKLKHMKLI